MPPHVNLSQVGKLMPRLPKGIRMLTRDRDGTVAYLLKDDNHELEYELGALESTFLFLLDGKTTVAEALSKTTRLLGRESLTEQETEAVLEWLFTQHLPPWVMSVNSIIPRQTSVSETPTASELATISELPTDPEQPIEVEIDGSVESSLWDTELVKASEQRLTWVPGARQQWKQWIKPVVLRVPFGNPDGFLAANASQIAWMFSAGMVPVWLLVGGLSLDSMWTRGESILPALSVFCNLDSLHLLVLNFLFVKTFRDLAVAVCCLQLGGRIPTWGILLCGFVPIPYIESHPALRVGKAAERHLRAGYCADLMLMALGLAVWSQSPPGFVRVQAAILWFSATVSSLLCSMFSAIQWDACYLLLTTNWQSRHGWTLHVSFRSVPRC